MEKRKDVLVSYLERNKIIAIPSHSKSDELIYLTKEFKRMFMFGENVNLQVTFQKFDSEWEAYIDLESPVILSHRDKLKAVVTPLLEDLSNSIRPSTIPEDSTNASVLSSADITPLCTPAISYVGEKHCSNVLLLSDDDTPEVVGTSPEPSNTEVFDDPGSDEPYEVPQTSKRPRLFDETSDHFEYDSQIQPAASSTPKSIALPFVVKKERPKEGPLPDPFPFPAHYRPDVELGLSSGKMSREAKRAFISSIASAMFAFKKHPSGDEYTRVACDIIKRYPFLKPPSGSPTNSIKQSLINRFKEFNRVPKARQINCDRKKSLFKETRKAPGIDFMKPPAIPDGEDETSFIRHNKVLLMESKKGHPNMAVVVSLMERTFGFRRADILASSSDVTTILEKYPFLQHVDQMYLEMQRIVQVERLQSSVRSSWPTTWLPRIYAQVSVEKHKNKRLAGIIDQLEISEGESSLILSIICLVYMLPESRVKPNHENIVWAIPQACDFEEAILEKGQSEPYILFIGTYKEPEQAFLIVDSAIIAEVDCKDVLLILMCAFFIFNICYTKGCNNFYLFCEYSVLNITNKKLPPSVSHFLASLHCNQVL